SEVADAHTVVVVVLRGLGRRRVGGHGREVHQHPVGTPGEEGGRLVIRAYKFLLRPTARRAAALGEMLRDHCSLCNGALQERRDAYRHTSKTRVRYGGQSAQLKEIRAFDPERQGRWSFSSQQATLRR